MIAGSSLGKGAALAVYSLSGRLMRAYSAGEFKSGKVNWDGRDASGKTAASGIYLVRLTAGSKTFTRTMLPAIEYPLSTHFLSFHPERNHFHCSGFVKDTGPLWKYLGGIYQM
jgi:hypothetical protein